MSEGAMTREEMIEAVEYALGWMRVRLPNQPREQEMRPVRRLEAVLAALSSAPPDLVALRLVLKCAERACDSDNIDAASDYVREAIRHVDKLAPAPPVAETPAKRVPDPRFFDEKGEYLDGPHYGKDCPAGKVQIEFVNAADGKQFSPYGWTPSDRASVDIYVDGRRFLVQVGTFHDGNAERRGLHIISESVLRAELSSINAASLWLEPASPVVASLDMAQVEQRHAELLDGVAGQRAAIRHSAPAEFASPVVAPAPV